MHKKGWLQILSLAAAVVSANALAQQEDPRGFYLGVSAGQSRVDLEDTAQVTGAGTTTVSNDETDSAFRIYGGYRILRNLAVEAGWADLGKFRTTIASATGSGTGEIEASGPYVEAVGIIPLQRFALFGKAGVMYATTDTTLSTTGTFRLAPGVSSTSKESELEFKLGVGGSFSFTRNLAIRAEFERVFDVGTSETGESDIDLISVGIVFRF
jgi:OmpA-OmpF porin, OOP family